VAVENSEELLFFSTSADLIKPVGSVKLGGPPVGLTCLKGAGGGPDGAEDILIGVTFTGAAAKLEACWLQSGASGVVATVIDKEGAKIAGSSAVLLDTIAAMSAAISELADEALEGEGVAATSTGQDQYLQKRRRHTEPGWKDHNGKKK